MHGDEFDAVWKALSDSTRQSILDLLRQGHHPQIVEAFPHLSRFGVMKHIDVLREAGLMHTREERRQRINSLNVVPIRQIHERWVGRFEEPPKLTCHSRKKSRRQDPGGTQRRRYHKPRSARTRANR